MRGKNRTFPEVVERTSPRVYRSLVRDRVSHKGSVGKGNLRLSPVPRAQRTAEVEINLVTVARGKTRKFRFVRHLVARSNLARIRRRSIDCCTYATSSCDYARTPRRTRDLSKVVETLT